ncbi:hypothetical protein OBBRIDRAFT_789944 [Obba rivulosa]|uniref:Uncharacterized protein n=1 Tax=Obba rivulosa TaxID=1052685 RepID=A0A8E2J397_9APHY|nr:hypothetical protein OBBRIDRAFT_789944 [Obba rivulosa]
MNLGPPPSAAGPSQPPPSIYPAETSGPRPQYSSSTAEQFPHAPTIAASSPGVAPQPPQPPLQYNATPAQYNLQQQYGSFASQSMQTQPLYYSPPSNTSQPPNYSYYGCPPNAWSNAWPADSYPYRAGSYQNSYSYNQGASTGFAQPAASAQQSKRSETPSPSPSPPPEIHKDWDAVMKSFLSAIGFTQTLRGFEADMIVLNPDWERKKIPAALGDLMKDLLQLSQVKEGSEEETPKERPLDERKLDYVHPAAGIEPRSQTSINKSISQFLAKNRARNDASNRAEFLQSLSEKRRRLAESGIPDTNASVSSCARTDAKTQNRDLQMKYDIAKNEDGPLRKTLKNAMVPGEASDKGKEKQKDSANTGDLHTAARHPGLDERLRNLEAHLAVRYVPSPPRSLLDRIKFMEDHIVHLEKEYPPWAALHFNQPNRGWPPPPRPTPIIVPSHLTSTIFHDPLSAAHGTAAAPPSGQAPTTSAPAAAGVDSLASKGKGKQGRHTKSSLHRAVMERLEVQKARNELAGLGEGE